MCTTEYIEVARNDSETVLTLECDVAPRLWPSPLISWLKDGELVSSALIGDTPAIEPSFLAANPILTFGVFDLQQFGVQSDGTVFLSTIFTNITNPKLGNLPPVTTDKQAKELLFNSFLGNWTCFVNNSLGSASVEYIVRELGKRLVLMIINDAPPIMMSLIYAADVTPPLLVGELWHCNALL